MIEQSFKLLVKWATLHDKQVMTEVYDLQTLIDIVSSPETPPMSHLFLLLEHLNSHPPLGDYSSLLSRLLDPLSTKDRCLVFFVMECIATLLQALGAQNIPILEIHRFRLLSSLNALSPRFHPLHWHYATAFAWLCAQTHLSGARLPSTLVLDVTARFLDPDLPKETLAVAVWLDVLREWIDDLIDEGKPLEVGVPEEDVDSIHRSLLLRLLECNRSFSALSSEYYPTQSRLIRTVASCVRKTKLKDSETSTVLSIAASAIIENQHYLDLGYHLHVCLFALRCIEAVQLKELESEAGSGRY